MGGLSAAAHLAKGGMKVLVLEQHQKVGGCASSFVRDDFAFDTALHEMSLGGGNGFLRALLKEVGVLDRVTMIRIPELGRSIYPGMEIRQKEGIEEYSAELISHFPQEEENIHAFFRQMAAMSDDASALRDIFFSSPLKALMMKMAVPFKQRRLAKYYNNNLQDVLDDFFEDERLKSAVAQFWVYHGPPPSEQWAIIYMLGQYSYIKNGGWQFVGSSSSLSEAYADRIREMGSEVMTSTRVKAINVEDNRVRGVTTADGKKYTSRYVVSNADPFQTWYKLVGIEHTPRSIRRQLEDMEPATSLAGVYLGLDVPVSFFGISDYEIFYNTSWDNDAMYRAMREGRWEEGLLSMTFYSNLPDDFYAPPDKASIVLHTYSDWKWWSDDDQEYEKQKDDMMDTLITMAEKVMPGLRDHIVYQEGMTPKTIHHYTLNYQGSPYGMQFNVENRNRMDLKSPIAGLYGAGAWYFPAHGVGMTQVSGYMAAKSILKEEDKN